MSMMNSVTGKDGDVTLDGISSKEFSHLIEDAFLNYKYGSNFCILNISSDGFNVSTLYFSNPNLLFIIRLQRRIKFQFGQSLQQFLTSVRP